jgi:AcrR family transcriptional regulator
VQPRRALARAEDREGSAFERILASAEQCFQRTNYAGVTLREIAEHAGVSKSLLLYHFDSKDHILSELQLRVHTRIARTVADAARRAGGPPDQRARVALRSLLAALRERNDLAAHALLGARALANDRLAGHVRRVRRELRALVHRTLRDIVGELADPQMALSLDAAADLLWAALTGLAVQAALDGDADLERGFESLGVVVSLALTRRNT